MIRRWKDRLWPTIDSPVSARAAVDRAVRIATLWAFVNGALGLVMTFSGTPIDSGGETISGVGFLLVGILFGVIAWRIHYMSRGWALAGLILAALELLTDLATVPSPIALIVHIVVLMYFINAVRGSFSYDRLLADQPVADRLA